MKTIDKYTLLPNACARIKATAMHDTWNGRDDTVYFQSCRWIIERFPCTVLFTRDVGYHTGGWWKNPDYERCWHLSIAFPDGKDKKGLADILTYLFGVNKNMIWVEPPYSKEGKSMEVWHYRLFCDEHWQPIIPRGEVYNTHFTERGWKSFSELNAAKS